MVLNPYHVDGNVYPVSGGAYPSSLVAMIDSFEDQDLSEYTGDKTYATVVGSGTVSPIDGDYALEIGQDGTNYMEIISSSGLDNYPAKGQEFDVWIRPTFATSSLSARFLFGYVDGNNKWELRLEHDGVQITAWTSGNASFSEDDTASTSANTWYRANHTWDDGSTFGGSDGEVTVELFDINGNSVSGPVSQIESTLTQGDVGWGLGGGTSSDEAYYDYGHIV